MSFWWRWKDMMMFLPPPPMLFRLIVGSDTMDSISNERVLEFRISNRAVIRLNILYSIHITFFFQSSFLVMILKSKKKKIFGWNFNPCFLHPNQKYKTLCDPSLRIEYKIRLTLISRSLSSLLFHPSLKVFQKICFSNSNRFIRCWIFDIRVCFFVIL